MEKQEKVHRFKLFVRGVIWWAVSGAILGAALLALLSVLFMLLGDIDLEDALLNPFKGLAIGALFGGLVAWPINVALRWIFTD